MTVHTYAQSSVISQPPVIICFHSAFSAPFLRLSSTMYSAIRTPLAGWWSLRPGGGRGGASKEEKKIKIEESDSMKGPARPGPRPNPTRWTTITRIPLYFNQKYSNFALRGLIFTRISFVFHQNTPNFALRGLILLGFPLCFTQKGSNPALGRPSDGPFGPCP